MTSPEAPLVRVVRANGLVLDPFSGQWRRLIRCCYTPGERQSLHTLFPTPPQGASHEAPPGPWASSLDPPHLPAQLGPCTEQEQTLGRERSPALLMSNNLFYDRKGNCLQFHKSETNAFEVVCPAAGWRRFLSGARLPSPPLPLSPSSLLITAASKLLA